MGKVQEMAKWDIVRLGIDENNIGLLIAGMILIYARAKYNIAMNLAHTN